jgi:putative membrane protein
MQRIILRWFVLSLAVWIAALVVPGIGYDNWQGVLAAALVLGILNAFVKPVFQLFSLPFIVLSFGLFLLVINAILLRSTAWLVSGFRVSGLWPAMGGSLVISIVSMFLSHSRPSGRIVVERTETMYSNSRRPPPGKGPVIDV